MIHLEAQAAVRLAAKVAVREQAWRDGHGVLGLPVRRDGEEFGPACTDVTVVCEAIDRAQVLVWEGPQLSLRRRGELSLHVAVRRPGSDDDGRTAVLVDPDRGDSPGVLRVLDTRTGASRPLSLAAASGGQLAGPVAEPIPMPTPRPTRARRGGEVLVWEVDDPTGEPLFRGDLDLAEDIYHSAPAGSHLLPVLAEAGVR